MTEAFTKGVYYIRNGPPPADVTNEAKLKVYALFKQATVGDVQGSQPYAVQFEARAKWDAWNALKGTTQEDAQAQYVAHLNSTAPGWETSDVVTGMPAGWKVGDK
eukprot:TRINITY_DN223_c1_g4_i1.p1 TRINITY_DN223_c1_g4~~TRINITY_DN223_c1_g4_i1.p1  ORF type:complete len:105 (+),score=39.56 TRINITY_DN223_c1_g4_i1:52-366(+)